MYGTWRFDSKSENDTLIQKVVNPANARPVVQQACDSCRNKKIKCSGDRPECSRCKVLSKPCIYSKGSTKRRGSLAHARRKSTQRFAQQPQEARSKSISQSKAAPVPINTTREASPEVQHHGNSLLIPVTAHAPTIATTPGFAMDQTWPGSLLPSDDPDMTSMCTVDLFSDRETMDTPIEQWFGAADTSQSDLMAGLTTSWAPIPEAAHVLRPDMTVGDRVEDKRLSTGLLTTPMSISSVTESCSCLQHVVFLVHELETAKSDSVDGQMASHKEAIDYGQAMMKCKLCSRRPENLMMLTFLSERLLQLGEAVTRRLGQAAAGEEKLAFLFGELEIDTAPEWEILLSSLVAVQLREFQQLLGQLKKGATTVGAEGVLNKVVDVERVSRDLMGRLRSNLEPVYT